MRRQANRVVVGNLDERNFKKKRRRGRSRDGIESEGGKVDTNCALQKLDLDCKCRDDARVGTARGTERGMVCVCVRGWWGLTYIHQTCTCCWCSLTCVCDVSGRW